MGAGQQALLVAGAAGGPTGTPHSRLYFPSTGAAGASPAFSGSWNGTSGADRLACVTTRISSAMTSKQSFSVAGTTEAFVAWRQYISAPLTAQTISGNVKAQVRCSTNSGNMNGTLACIIRVVSNDGSTVRGTILAMTATDDFTTYEFTINPAITNRKLRNVSEAASIALSSLAISDGDRLCIEWGFRQQATSSNTTRVGEGYFGDDSGTDLPEDDTTTAADNPWLEFSSAVYFQ